MAVLVNPLDQVASQFVNGLSDNGDGTGTLLTSMVGFQDLDFTQIFGKSCTSTTENIVSYGVKVFTLDADVDNIKLDYTVQFRSIDPDVWMYGIVTEYSLLVSPAQITVNIIKISPLVGTYDNWTIQVVAGPAFGLPASAALGYSSNSFAIPAIGDTVSLTTDAGKIFQTGSKLLIYSLTDSTQYFYGTSVLYNVSTGALSTFAQLIGPGATGTFANWAVVAIDGPTTIPSIIGTSSTSISTTLPANNVISITTQAGKSFQEGGLIYVVSRSDSSQYIFGQIDTYTPLTGAMDVIILRPNFSVTTSDWNITQSLGDITPDSKHGINITVDAGGGFRTVGASANFVLGHKYGVTAQTTNRAIQTITSDRNTNLTYTGDLTVDSSFEVDGNGHKLTLTSDATLPATAVSASTQAQMEAATDTTTFVSPGRQVYHPTQAKALYSATITPTATGVNVSAVDATNDVVTITGHGFTTGDQIETVASWPAGVTNGQVYYVNALSVNTLALYTTLANALADTSRVNITATTTGGTSRRFVFSNVDSYGLSAVSPIAGVPGTTTVQLAANLSPSLSATHCWATIQPGVGLFSAGAVGFASPPTTITTGVLTFTVLLSAASGGAVTGTSTWIAQGTTPFTVQFIMYGDLP